MDGASRSESCDAGLTRDRFRKRLRDVCLRRKTISGGMKLRKRNRRGAKKFPKGGNETRTEKENIK